MRINWNEHNLLAKESEPVTPLEVATASQAETPKEPDTVNLTPQTGNNLESEISSDGDKLKDEGE